MLAVVIITLLVAVITLLVVAITIFINIFPLASESSCIFLWCFFNYSPTAQSQSLKFCTLGICLCESSLKRLLAHPVILLVHIKALLQIVIFAVLTLVNFKFWKEPSSLLLAHVVLSIARSFSVFSSLFSWAAVVVTFFFCHSDKSSLTASAGAKRTLLQVGINSLAICWHTETFLPLFSLYLRFYRSFRDLSNRFQISW